MEIEFVAAKTKTPIKPYDWALPYLHVTDDPGHGSKGLSIAAIFPDLGTQAKYTLYPSTTILSTPSPTLLSAPSQHLIRLRPQPITHVKSYPQSDHRHDNRQLAECTMG